jgi:8-oxo-dGTP diphosphatase
MAPDTYREILARNIRAARSRLGIGQDNVALRMRALGYDAWIRQTVSSTERGRRRPTAEEILGLAACLGTTVQHLMSPLLFQDGPVELPSGAVLAPGQVRSLIFGTGPNDEQIRGSSVQGATDLRGIRWQGDAPVWEGSEHPATRPIPEETKLQMPVVAAIVTSELGVLVGKRNDGKPPWTFIAGEQDAVKDENPADTAVRETKEEAGLRIQPGEVIGERDHPKTGRHMIYLAAAPTHGTDVFVGDEEELAEVRWVSLAELDELMGAGNIFAPVREHLARELGEV